MNDITVIVNDELLARLHGLSRPFDFCDEQGRVLGRFIPSPAPSDLEPAVSEDELRRRAENFRRRPLADYLGRWEPSFSEQELNEMEQETGGRSLKEILADLRSGK